MSSMINAREEILSRIRAALSNVPRDEQPEAVPVERTYRRSGESLETNREVLIERFIERVAEYKVTLRRVEEPELPAAIAAICNVRGARRLVVPADVPENWLPGALELLRDEPPLSNEQLDTSDGVLTGCALGICGPGT